MNTDRVEADTTLTRVYDFITGDEDARVCKDIPEAACHEMPRNLLLHLLASTATKIGDELVSAKLVLPWVLSALSAPAYLAGLVVPIRESGALMPQLLVAGYIRPFPVRKWFWVAGSVLQGLAVLGMVLAALEMRGAAAGWTIVALLVGFSLARGVCSVAYKDVLGKTVSKQRRGTVMGYASAAAGIVTIAVGAFAKGASDASWAQYFFLGMLLVAALLWCAAAGIFAALGEEPGSTEGGGNAFWTAVESVGLLRTDVQFRHFVLTRALLMATALSIPFYVILANEQTGVSVSGLGLMIVASGLAGSVSAPVWGRLADRLSRLVMAVAGLLSGILGVVVFALTLGDASLLDSEYSFAGLFLVMSVAHSGARLGRKTYLVDMATPETRPAYVAVSNSVIGILILVAGAGSAAAELLGTGVVILIFALVALVAATSALRLPEVEQEGL